MEQSRELLINDTAIKENPILRCCLMKPKTLADLSCDKFAQLPESMGSLVSLTQLNLSYTGIKELPEFIGSMELLETLDVSGCKSLARLPSSIGNLVSLSRLNLRGCELLREIPDSIGNFRGLQAFFPLSPISPATTALSSPQSAARSCSCTARRSTTTARPPTRHSSSSTMPWARATVRPSLISCRAPIKFNGGGHVNQSMFWKNLAPIQGGGGEPPKGSLGWAIGNHFCSLDALVQKMNAEGLQLRNKRC
ncbi:hypothetical protein NL676_035235 [Syzygium grande]|nr:hypothetical protein NL676_035235 [Syzygium grande]